VERELLDTMSAEKLYGVRPILEALQSSSRRIVKIFIGVQRTRDDIRRLLTLAAERGVAVEIVQRAQLPSWQGPHGHQGVVALVEPLQQAGFPEVLHKISQAPGRQAVLLLDGVTDVGNFATLVRSAVAFGVTAIILPRHRSVALTPTVAKLSAGAIERVTITEVVNMVRAIEMLRAERFWIYGSDAQTGMPIAQVVWAERLALILGSEGRGMRRLVRENCDVLVRIPMHPGADSLNVAIAGAIILAYSWDQHAQ